ncbi:MAG: HAMP domain-containing sensor histidine kinase [Anaerolineales bacterium]
MKRIGVVVALLLPALVLAFWALVPAADVTLAAPLFHFYVVTFTTFAATVVSLFVTISVGETALPHHLLLAVAFAWMGAVFLIHGLTTPGAVIVSFHPAIVTSAWLTLFGGGLIFLLGAFAPNQPSPVLLRRTALVIMVIYAIYVAIVILIPRSIAALLALPISPHVADIAFVVTLLIWLAASVQHLRHYRRTHNFVDGLMAFEAGWFTIATVSMFRFALWFAGWWVYHVLLLAGFLIASYALWRAYEGIRAFRLTRYYAATSLIVTAALALLAAHLYANVVYDNMREQLEHDTSEVSQHVATLIAESVPNVTSAAHLSAVDPAGGLAAATLSLQASLPDIGAITLYDTAGAPVYSTLQEPSADGSGGLPPAPDADMLAGTLLGQTSFELMAPGLPVPGYVPTSGSYVLETYTPFFPAGRAGNIKPIGALMVIREAPELDRALILSRAAGLVLAIVSLGGLFAALLVIVFRADGLIRTRTLELETAYANLRQAEGLRDDLTNMIVHDLRSPLTALTANLDLITRTLNNPAYADAPTRFLAAARAAGHRMTGMIDDLLNVGKFEAGELHPVLTPVYLPTLLGDKLDAFRPQAEKENKTLRIEAPPDLPTVQADPALIARVVDNLLSNAIKYTDAGGHVGVSAARQQRWVEVRVSDDGEGIPPEFHSRIFDKFGQVLDKAGAPLRKGTGLGLAFCRLAVEAHGGTLRVDSAPGQGSTFTFTLPLSGGAN